MSDPEAGLRWFLHKHKEQSHEIAALISLEPQAAVPLLDALEKRLADFRPQLEVRTALIIGNPLNTYIAICKVQRRIDALRVVEAIRNYAATHKSQFPKSLDQIVDTSSPDDLLTGKPFRYEVTGGGGDAFGSGISSQRERDGSNSLSHSIAKIMAVDLGATGGLSARIFNVF